MIDCCSTNHCSWTMKKNIRNHCNSRIFTVGCKGFVKPQIYWHFHGKHYWSQDSASIDQPTDRARAKISLLNHHLGWGRVRSLWFDQINFFPRSVCMPKLLCIPLGFVVSPQPCWKKNVAMLFGKCSLFFFSWTYNYILLKSEHTIYSIYTYTYIMIIYNGNKKS